jgi:hypothetical protein
MKKMIATLFVALCITAVAVPFADAGRVNGPGKDTTICQAYGSITYNVTMYGGEQARIAIVGDGSTDLDIFVYDQAGRLVVQGIGLTDVELVTWFPNQTQTYRVVVRNLGGTWNQYSMATN